MNWSCVLSDGDVPADMDMLANFFGDSLDCTAAETLLDSLAPDTGNGSAFRPTVLPTTKSQLPTGIHSSENDECLRAAGNRPATRASPRFPMKLCTLEDVTCIKVEPFTTGPGASASGTDGDAALSSASWERGEAGSARQRVTGLEMKVEQTGRRARGGSAKRPRTSVQQQQNKLAQQRYREKRKQKVCELEQRAAELEAQLEAVRSANRLPEGRLTDETAVLRERVAEQQRTIDDLRRELRTVTTAAESRLTAHPACMGSADPGSSAGGAATAAPACTMVNTPEEALARIVELTGVVRQALASKGRQTSHVVV